MTPELPIAHLNQFRRQVLAALQSFPEGSKLWLCYDPVLNPSLEADQFILTDTDRSQQPTQRLLRLPNHLDISEAQRPRFIDLGADLDHRLFEASIVHAAQETVTSASCRSSRSICAWVLATEQAITDFAQRTVQRQPGKGERWVRWFDPRVMHQVWPALQSPQQSQLLSGINAWVMPDLWGRVQVLMPPPAAATASSTSLGLTPPQWAMLMRSHTVIDGLAYHEQLGHDLTGDTVRDLHHTLAHLETLSLTSETDREDLLKVVIQHPLALQDEGVQQAINMARQDPGALTFHLPPSLKPAADYE